MKIFRNWLTRNFASLRQPAAACGNRLEAVSAHPSYAPVGRPALRSRFEGHARTYRSIARCARHPADAGRAWCGQVQREGVWRTMRASRLPVHDKRTGGAEVHVGCLGPRVPPTAPWSCVLPACVSGTGRRHAVPAFSDASSTRGTRAPTAPRANSHTTRS